MNKKFKGYISSRKLINGEFETQKIQNLVVREACKYNSYDLQLSSVEYIMSDCYMILNSLIKNLKKYDGIVFFSLFQLPLSEKKRKIIYDKFLEKKKTILFANEKLELRNKNDILLCENIIKVAKMLKFTPKKIN
jgi:sporadic carbohydrate cluster protein (TIGR04323 family)